jgi:sugar (pentulose or hexulose) kinase
MGREEVILVFDVGKTNKKFILFNTQFKIILEKEVVFPEIADEDGFPCEDADKLETWIDRTLIEILQKNDFQVSAVNFSTYGATLVFLDKAGQRITPVYNYLKPMPEEVMGGFYEKYGGKDEFCRRTASPSLGMLNSGLQILWMKKMKPGSFSRVRHILHLPQYLSFRYTKKITSEHTSIGCHTAIWDFDSMDYHPWIDREEISLPAPGPNFETVPVTLGNSTLRMGMGIHDSSASLVPYIISAREPFVLVSTGTWCINMNPFNHEPLTAEELRQDCLCFLSVNREPVKASRFFLGRIHDVNLQRLESRFGTGEGAYKSVDPGAANIGEAWRIARDKQIFFREGIPADLIDNGIDLNQFRSFDEAYIQLMMDLSGFVVKAIRLVLSGLDLTRHLYITGGFAGNRLFTTALALAFPDKRVFTSEVKNSSSLGAALVMASRKGEAIEDKIDLGLQEIITGPD